VELRRAEAQQPRRAVAIAKLAVSVGVLVFLARRVEMTAMARALADVRRPFFVVALALYMAGQLLCARKWALLANALGFRRRYADYARFYYVGMFVNLLGPSTIGGDVVRALALGDDGRRGLAVTSVLADRVSGLFVLVLIGVTALGLVPTYGLPLALSWIAGAFALALFFGWWSLPWLARLLPRAHRIRQVVERDLAPLWSDRGLLGRVGLLAAVFHLGEAGIEYCLARALGLDVPYAYCVLLHPAVSILAAVPVSIAGLGIREGGYVFFLERIGVPAPAALAFGLLWFAVVVLGALPGGILLWRPAPGRLRRDAVDGAASAGDRRV
jgi:hypothetical protein